MIWPVPDAPAMACHESGGPPARSAATLGGENHHLRVDGLHLRCPTNSSRAPPGAIPVDCQVSHRPPLRTSGSPPGGDLDESARPAGEEAAVSAAQCIGQLEQGRLIQGHRSVLFCEFLGGFSQSLTRWPPDVGDRHDHQAEGPELHHSRELTPQRKLRLGLNGRGPEQAEHAEDGTPLAWLPRKTPSAASSALSQNSVDRRFAARASPRSPSTCLST